MITRAALGGSPASPVGRGRRLLGGRLAAATAIRRCLVLSVTMLLVRNNSALRCLVPRSDWVCVRSHLGEADV